jgi:hypothetical protein
MSAFLLRHRLCHSPSWCSTLKDSAFCSSPTIEASTTQAHSDWSPAKPPHRQEPRHLGATRWQLKPRPLPLHRPGTNTPSGRSHATIERLLWWVPSLPDGQNGLPTYPARPSATAPPPRATTRRIWHHHRWLAVKGAPPLLCELGAAPLAFGPAGCSPIQIVAFHVFQSFVGPAGFNPKWIVAFLDF